MCGRVLRRRGWSKRSRQSGGPRGVPTAGSGGRRGRRTPSRVAGSGAAHCGGCRGVRADRSGVSATACGRGSSTIHRTRVGVAIRRASGRPGDPAAGGRVRAGSMRRTPADADLVVIGNPTNPTSVLHPSGRPARTGAARPDPGRRRGVHRRRTGRTRVARRRVDPGPRGDPQPDQDLGTGGAAHRVRPRRTRIDRATGRRSAALAGVHSCSFGGNCLQQRACSCPRRPMRRWTSIGNVSICLTILVR